MKVITEIELRDLYKREPFKSYVVPEDMRLTPSAQQYLSDLRIEVLDKVEAVAKASDIGEKPEAYTHLNGHELVAKHHGRIRFRGMADSFYGFMVETELFVSEKKITILENELRILRKYAGQIMMAEVTDKPLAFINFYGWSPEEIRKRSHYPQEYYGIGHFRAHPLNGVVMARLNIMRTRVRELEVAASELFGPTGTAGERLDIILALNRFSSIAYILMCRLKSGGYENGS